MDWQTSNRSHFFYSHFLNCFSSLAHCSSSACIWSDWMMMLLPFGTLYKNVTHGMNSAWTSLVCFHFCGCFFHWVVILVLFFTSEKVKLSFWILQDVKEKRARDQEKITANWVDKTRKEVKSNGSQSPAKFWHFEAVQWSNYCETATKIKQDNRARSNERQKMKQTETQLRRRARRQR